MTIKMIVACDQGNSIGWTNGELPWRIPVDMDRFKTLTTGHNVVMGMNTFRSLKRKDGLPNRDNYVLTRQPWESIRAEIGQDVNVIQSLDYVSSTLSKSPYDTWIIGGSQIYAQALEKQLIDEIYLTQVHELSGGDITLPFDLYSWKLFVIRQRNIGINWDLVTATNPKANFPITMLHFKKLSEPKS